MVEVQFAERGDKAALESGADFAPKFDANGLICVVTTDAASGEVLMVAYMNRESLARTMELGEAVYWSRSRSELWHKGATSGHVQKVVELRTDCDQDALWMRVEQQGPGACHTGHRSCFYRRVILRQPGPARLEPTESDRAFDPSAVYGTRG